MKEPRHVIEKKGRYLVAIPAGVREHLGLVKGAQVWWHTTRKGDVALTVSGRRRRGDVQQDADCPSCARFREEATRLRTMLRTTTVVDYNTAFAQGVQQGVKIVPVWRAELDTLHTEVNDMRRLLAQLVVKLPDRKPRWRRRAERVARERIEADPPFADDFDGEGRLIPRPVETVELPPPPADAL